MSRIFINQQAGNRFTSLDRRLAYSRNPQGQGDMWAVRKFGANADVGTAAFEAVRSLGGSFYFPTSSAAVRVKAGGNTNDTFGGSGAHSITIEGLDENWMWAREVIILSGSSVSPATTTSWNRIFRGYVNYVGVYGGTNAGNIVLEQTSSIADLLQIPAGVSQTEYCAYTVPAGYTGYVMAADISVESTKSAEIRYKVRESADDVVNFRPAKIQHRHLSTSENSEQTAEVFGRYPEKTDLYWIAKATGQSATQVVIDFDILIVKNELV